MLHHWRENVPADRPAHLVKDAMCGLTQALQLRLVKHQTLSGAQSAPVHPVGGDGLIQRELSGRALQALHRSPPFKGRSGSG